jgi:uncharacterized repeat protein (TIGR03803 family)
MKTFGILKMACTIFVVCAATAIAAPAQTFTTLHIFDGTDGEYPAAGLVQGTDGNFYGTTGYGGATTCTYGCGTIFKITPAGTLTTLHSFDYTDGEYPLGVGLVQATDGNFYGTTYSGAAYGYGTVFKITPASALTTLHSFDSTDGANPKRGLLQATDGNFYGTTHSGGAYGYGTVFKITPASALTTLHSFDSTDGADPEAGLVQGTDGSFYGTTYFGGAYNYGTIFKITPAGTLTTLHSFDYTDGEYPLGGGLVQATDGNFYGTTSEGANGYGTVFKITPTGTLTTLHSFHVTDGAYPEALVQATDGNFYGTTSFGGTAGNCTPGGCGTVFKITPGGTLTTLHNFANTTTEGAVPGAGLVQATDGNFYGTTADGGAYADGTVFSLSVGLSPPFPRVTLSTTSLGFGNQVIDTTSAAKTVTVANTGSVTLDISSTTASANFAISAKTCGATLAVGKNCKVSVTFTPTVLGKVTGTLTLTDNAPNSPQALPLSGTGVEPATLAPASATYAAQAVGTTSPAKTFTLANNQTVVLTSIAISTTGDFAVSTTTCTTSLAAKSKCTISVTFTPTETGTRTGELNVSDSASNSPQTMALTGTGVVPATLTPASFIYPKQTVGTTSAAKTFTLTNNQNVALTSIAISTYAPYAVSATTCTTSLAAKGKCTISVTFTPQGTASYEAGLFVNDSASNSPQTSSLLGTGK